MTFAVCPLIATDGALAWVVVVDPATGQVWMLSHAGAEPEPFSDAERDAAAEAGARTVDDLVGVVASNMMVSMGPPQSAETLEDALTAADQLWFREQKGREPRPDVPSDLAARIRSLDHDLASLEANLRRATDQFRRRLGSVEAMLTRDIELPDRHHAPDPPADRDASAALADTLAQLDSLLVPRDMPESAAQHGAPSAEAEQKPADAEARQVDTALTPRAPLSRLGLSTRLVAVLGESGITTVGDLLRRSDKEVAGLDGVGRASMNQIQQALRDAGLELARWPDAEPRTPAPPSSPGLEQRGRIKAYDVKRGFGFITPEEGREDIFFHINESPALDPTTLLRGVEVVYRLTYREPKGWRAQAVQPRPRRKA